MMKTQPTTTSKRNPQQGYLLILVMAVSIVMVVLSISIISISSTKYAKTTADIDAANAIYTAEAGVSDTLAQLNLNGTFTGYTTKKQFYGSNDQGKAEYTTTVTDNGNKTLTISSTAYMSRRTTDATPFTTKVVKALIVETETPVIENVIAGAAGLDMSGSFFPWYGQPSAMTKGMVYSRGKINLNGSATSIGTATDSARVTATNIGCGTTANWPQPCASNDPPLVFSGGSYFFGGSGSIYGSVCATNQPSAANIYPGPTGTGWQSGCIAPDYGLPYFDKKAFTSKQIIPALPIPPLTGCLLFGPTSPQWLDHQRIVGNITIQGNFGACNVTIYGDVYIQGNLTLGSGGKITVADSLGSRRPTIVVNGTVSLAGNSNGIFANGSNTPLTIISFSSTNAGRSNDDNYSDSLSSTDLYNSSVIPVNNYFGGAARAITVGGGCCSGSDTADYSGLAVYSYYGSTLYSMSGNHSLRGIGGQQVSISPGGNFSFTGGTLSVTDTSPFSWVLGRTKYQIGDYLQTYN